MKNEIKGCIKALGKLIFSFNDAINEAVEFPKEHFQPCANLKTNLKLFAAAVQKIDDKYLTRTDKCLQLMAQEEVALAKCLCHFRAGNFSMDLLQKAVTLAAVYGTRRQAKEIKREAQKIAFQYDLRSQNKNLVTDSKAKWEIMEQLMADITHNINPADYQPEEQIAWEQILDSFEEKLREKNLDLKGMDYNSEIEELFTSAREAVVPLKLAEKLKEVAVERTKKQKTLLETLERGRE